MARAKSYKRDEVLDKAMRLFWRQGYLNTSLQQLEAATNVNRYGLYDSFGSKHQLFLETLDHYLDTVVRECFGILEQGGGLDAIKAFFLNFAALSRSEIGSWGCFACNSVTELAPHDPAVAERVARYTAWMESAFRHAAKRAQEKGEIADTLSTDALAASLTMSTLGLFVYSKSPVSREQFAQACDAIVTSLG